MTDDEITKLLFVAESPVPADLAMVFAASDEEDMLRRTKRGVELYEQGYVPRLLVTGGGVLAQKRPEAKRMAEIARALGVPVQDLLVEDRSGNTFQNVQFSLELLTTHTQNLLDTLGTVILVSSQWHMRRVLLTVQAFFPKTVKAVCCPTSEGCNRDNWTSSSGCRRTVLDEALLLQTLQETGAI